MRKLQSSRRVLVFLSTAVIISLPGTMVLAATQNTVVPQIKADFNKAMSEPLELRRESLRKLEPQIEEAISGQSLIGRDMTEALYYKFQTQKELAEYAQACQSCTAYIQRIKQRQTFDPMLVSYLKDLPLETGNVRLTKYHINRKTFYYVQFLRLLPTEPSHSRTLEYRDTGTTAQRVRLTIMLGFVPDGSTAFALPQAFYNSLDGPLYKQSIRLKELNHWFADFHKAISLAQTRLESDIRRSLSDINKWLDEPTGYVPEPEKRKLAALKELHSFKVRLFENGS